MFKLFSVNDFLEQSIRATVVMVRKDAIVANLATERESDDPAQF